MRRDRDGPRRPVRVPGSGDDSTLMSAPQATIRGPMVKRERGPSRQQTAAIFVGFCPDATRVAGAGPRRTRKSRAFRGRGESSQGVFTPRRVAKN